MASEETDVSVSWNEKGTEVGATPALKQKTPKGPAAEANHFVEQFFCEGMHLVFMRQ